MANGRGRMVDLSQAGLTQTNGATTSPSMAKVPDGPDAAGARLTRAGAFMPNAEGELVNPDGYQLLDEGRHRIVIPPTA